MNADLQMLADELVYRAQLNPDDAKASALMWLRSFSLSDALAWISIGVKSPTFAAEWASLGYSRRQLAAFARFDLRRPPTFVLRDAIEHDVQAAPNLFGLCDIVRDYPKALVLTIPLPSFEFSPLTGTVKIYRPKSGEDLAVQTGGTFDMALVDDEEHGLVIRARGTGEFFSHLNHIYPKAR